MSSRNLSFLPEDRLFSQLYYCTLLEVPFRLTAVSGISVTHSFSLRALSLVDQRNSFRAVFATFFGCTFAWVFFTTLLQSVTRFALCLGSLALAHSRLYRPTNASFPNLARSSTQSIPRHVTRYSHTRAFEGTFSGSRTLERSESRMM